MKAKRYKGEVVDVTDEEISPKSILDHLEAALDDLQEFAALFPPDEKEELLKHWDEISFIRGYLEDDKWQP